MESLENRIQRQSDRELVCELKNLVRRDCALEADLLLYLGEVDRRRLYRNEGCPSMFAYCSQVLHFGEGQAYHRIHTARAAQRYPKLLEKVRSGEIHLSGAGLLAPRLTDENAEQLIGAATRKSKREIECMLAELEPKEDAPPRVRRLPSPTPSSAASKATSETASPPAAQTPSIAPRSSPRPAPLGGERFRVQFTATREVHDLLEEARALLRHQIPDAELAEIFERALRLLVQETKKRRFAVTDRPRSQRKKGGSGRAIPAAIRREVYERDKGRCTFVARSGRRCEAREFLEYDHLDLWAANGVHEANRITLRCRAHNQLAAEQELGRGFMQRKRESQLTPG